MANVSQEIGSVEKSSSKSVMGVGASKSEVERVTVGGKQLVEASSGLVTSIRVIEEDEGRKGWEVSLVATVAKFTAPGMDKPTVSVGTPRGDDVSADVSALIRERIGGALSSSGKVAVLDRSDDGEIAAELDLAGSGTVAATEALKQGQARVADFIVQVTVDVLRVNRNARTLRMSGREVVSYTGQASAAFRLVHVATRQVMASGKASASRGSEEALQDNVDSDTWRREMMEEIATKLAADVSAALLKTSQPAATGDASASPASPAKRPGN